MNSVILRAFLMIACLVVPVPVGADRMVLVPQVELDKQVCFQSDLRAYISEFDGRRFHIYALIHKCDQGRKLPTECSPYVVSNADKLPKEVRKAVNSDTLVLKHEFQEWEVLMVEFSGDMQHGACQVGDFNKGTPKRRLPTTGWILPTRVTSEAIVDREDLDKIGVRGEFVALDWSTAFMKKDIRLNETVTIPVETSALYATNKRISFGGVVKAPGKLPEYHIVDGIVERAGRDMVVFKVTNILQTAAVLKPEVGAQAAFGIVSAVKIKIQPTATTQLGWLGVLRGVKEELPLELRVLRSDDERVVEIATTSPRLQGSYELIRLLRPLR